MAAAEEDGSNWLIELGLMEDLIPSLQPNDHSQWPSNAFSLPNNLSSGLDDSYGNSDILKECGSKKRYFSFNELFAGVVKQEKEETEAAS